MSQSTSPLSQSLSARLQSTSLRCKQLVTSPIGTLMIMMAVQGLYNSLRSERIHRILQWMASTVEFPKVFQWWLGVMAVRSVVKASAEIQWYLAQSLHQQSLTAVTSQVVATRSNVMEWRSCLMMLSKWHRCSLQGAYKLWQSKSGSVPPCPANQWMRLESGQPMNAVDQCLADQAVPQRAQHLQFIDTELTAVHEQYLLVQETLKAGECKWSDVELGELESVEGQWQEFRSKCLEFQCFDTDKFESETTQWLEQFEAQLDWDLIKKLKSQ